MSGNGRTVAVVERVRTRPATVPVPVSVLWTLVLTAALAVAGLFSSVCVLLFQVAPDIRAVAAEARERREREKDLSDAAALIQQREADLLVQQAENVRLAKELQDRLKGESK